MDAELERVRAALVEELRVTLGPDQGQEAFERHQLLAIRFHRAARLNTPGAGERDGWRAYFNEHFHRGGEHATLLFEKWRTALLKDERPGRGVAITHGQPAAHWQMTPLGLCVNLESMWDDFGASVDHFLGNVSDDRRTRTLAFFEKTQWSVQAVEISVVVPRVISPESQVFSPSVITASATAMAPDLLDE